MRRADLRVEPKGSPALRHSIRVAATGLLCATLAALGASPTDRPVDEESVGAALASLGPSFGRSETDRFVILCDGAVSWSRSSGVLLETTFDRFERLMRHLGLPMVEPDSKLQCVLIQDHDRFEAFALGQDGIEAGWMGGYYATHTNRVVFYDTETAPAFARAREKLDELNEQADRAREQASDARRGKKPDAEELYRTLAVQARASSERQRRMLADRAAQAGAAKTTHEAAHLLAFNCGLQLRSRQYPFWLSEGLATCFEAESVEAARKGRFGPDRENPVRQREFAAAIAEATLVPLEALVEMNAADPDEDVSRVMYAQAHALYRWLHRHEREALAGLYTDIAREPAGMIGARRQGEMFRARFGDIAKLERKWLRDAGAEALKIAAAVDGQ